MNNKILIEVYVPILETEYDVFVPINKKVKNVIKLSVDAIHDLSNGCLPQKNNYVLYNRINGILLDIKSNVKQAGLVNGSQVILI